MIFFLFLLISSISFLNVSSDSLKCYANDLFCSRGNTFTNCNLTTYVRKCDKPANCITVVGTFDKKPVRYKTCESESDYVLYENRTICAIMKERFVNISCSICDYDNCNKGGSLTCYGCSDKPRCFKSVKLTCFDDNFSCFSARGYDKYNKLVNERGCVPNEKIEPEYERYREKGFTYSVCNDSDLCNTDRTGPLLTCRSHYGQISCGGSDNFVCINTIKYYRGQPYEGCVIKDAANEYCEVDNRTGDIPCYICEEHLCNVKGNLCFECFNYEKCISSPELHGCVSEDYDCFTAKGIEDGKPVLQKGCISKNRVDVASKQYAKRNLSFTNCYGELCNGEQNERIMCHICYSTADCPVEKRETCPTDDFICISAKGFDKDGKYMVRKHCVFGLFASYECDKYKKRGLSCSVCNSDLCNIVDDQTQDPTGEDNYTEIDDYSIKEDDNPTETDSYHTERMYLSESKVSSISSIILLVTVLTCTRLL